MTNITDFGRLVAELRGFAKGVYHTLRELDRFDEDRWDIMVRVKGQMYDVHLCMKDDHNGSEECWAYAYPAYPNEKGEYSTDTGEEYPLGAMEE